jgi:2-polyprenyl-3-methyl-5-hydroxy-6-metoxy-1,4-benzoquinol methylase
MASVIYPKNYISYLGSMADPHSIMRYVKRIVVTRRFRKATGSIAHVRILEVGCGDGDLLVSLRDAYPNLELVGLDFQFHPAILQRMADHRIDVITGFAESAALPEAHFDVVIMNQLIEHLWEPDKVLAACWKAMKPGAVLTLETPNPDGYDRKQFRKSLWGNYYFPRHLNLFSQSGLERLLKRNGFRVTQRVNLLAPLNWVFTMHSISRKIRGLSWIRRLFGLTNPVPVAGFAAVDVVFLAVGLQTSNQKVVAVRVSSPHDA